MSSARKPLGVMLVEAGLVRQSVIEDYLLRQKKTGETLGAMLVADEVVSEDQLNNLLGRQLQVHTVRLTSTADVDEKIARRFPEALARAYSCVPYDINDNTIDIAFDALPTEKRLLQLERDCGMRINPHLAPRRDIENYSHHVYGVLYDEQSRLGLLQREPRNSASTVITGRQKIWLGLIIAALVLGSVFAFTTTMRALLLTVSIAYVLTTTYKLIVIALASSSKTTGEMRFSDDEIASLDERTLPPYTILIPLYQEAAIVPSLVNGIAGLDYPKSKLDVRLLCEENDPETIKAVRDLNLPPHFKLVICPDTQPKTKPKACNYGLWQAVGEYVVIYDAEDRPDPAQLKKAVLAFRTTGEEVVCVQAKLNYFNQNQNLLTRWFAAEYAMLFDLTLPGLARMKAPIPLGGTSNHFRRDVLMAVGAWDPYNVTEDADLGIRLHKAGYRTTMIDSTTLEEANSALGNWIRQRSRWNKGYYITWLVHMRQPIKLMKELGLKDFFSFQMMVGAPWTLLVNPLLWVATAVSLIYKTPIFEGVLLHYLSLFLLTVGNISWIAVSVWGVCRRKAYDSIPAALITFIYWAIMSIAAYKGAIQLITKPFYWEKTVHGLDDEHVYAMIEKEALENEMLADAEQSLQSVQISDEEIEQDLAA